MLNAAFTATEFLEEEEHSVPDVQGVLPIYSVTPFTMLDFPDRMACIVWFSGCNMRCSYCHNPQIVRGKGRGEVAEVFRFLHSRKGLLEGVVLSGGEACVYKGLPDFIRKVKAMGFVVKLDTNGLRPDILEGFLKERLVDYVALDYKAPPEKFKVVTGRDRYENFSKTLDFLCAQRDIPFEVRTTVHTGLMNEQDVQKILDDLKDRGFSGLYSIQNFRADDGRPTLGMLPPQERVLDRTLLSIPRQFRVEERNF